MRKYLPKGKSEKRKAEKWQQTDQGLGKLTGLAPGKEEARA